MYSALLPVILAAMTVANSESTSIGSGQECPLVDYINDVTRRLVNLEEQQKSTGKEQPVAVIAQIQLPRLQRINKGQTIIFNHAITNIGNAFNTHLGHFEAPVTGTYFFSVTLCMLHAHWVNFGIMKDGHVLAETFVGDRTWHTCVTSTAATYMNTRQKVWVKVLLNQGDVDITRGKSSFTGVLMNTFQKFNK